MRSALAVTRGVVFFIGACGASETGPVDSGFADGGVDAVRADGGAVDSVPDGNGPDGSSSSMTGCGTLSCDRATQVCVSCECGGPTRFSCEPVSASCQSDRSCGCLAATVCAPTASNPYAMCYDVGDNEINCDRGLD